MYRYVVIDTPPAFSEHVLSAFDLSDAYVLLATLDVPALKNLRLTLDMLDLLGYPRSSWLVVLNRSDSKVGLAVDEVEKTLRSPVAAQIPSSRAVQRLDQQGRADRARRARCTRSASAIHDIADLLPGAAPRRRAGGRRAVPASTATAGASVCFGGEVGDEPAGPARPGATHHGASSGPRTVEAAAPRAVRRPARRPVRRGQGAACTRR